MGEINDSSMEVQSSFLQSSALDIVSSIYARCISCSEFSIDKVVDKVECQLRADFHQDYEKIPSLNEISFSDLKNDSLVRVRCMIQDMRETELVPTFHSDSIKPICCLFRDDFGSLGNIDLSLDNMKHFISRQVLHCVAVPGEASWFQSKAKSLKTSTSESSLPCTAIEQDYNADSEPPFKKMVSESEVIDSSKDVSFKSKNVIVKMYREDGFKLNDIIEFIGIWSSGVNSVDNDESICPPSLHAITHNKIGHNYDRSTLNLDSSWISTTRSHLLDHLQNFLLHDKLAAEYLLCNLIASTVRHDLSCVAKVTLNLCNVPGSNNTFFVQQLHQALMQICSKVHYLPLSLDVLNKESFVPKKDYDNDCLITARLQLSAGTLLIIDETKLEVGQLFEQGVKNIATLKTLINHQKLDYDFIFHGIEFTTDLNILILSEGVSCLPADFFLRLEAKESDEQYIFSCKNVDNLRTYLLAMKSKQLDIDDKMQEKIRNDFVQMRKTDKSTTESKLHELLTVSRWMTCTYGAKKLLPECWEKAKEMEKQRLERNPIQKH